MKGNHKRKANIDGSHLAIQDYLAERSTQDVQGMPRNTDKILEELKERVNASLLSHPSSERVSQFLKFGELLSNQFRECLAELVHPAWNQYLSGKSKQADTIDLKRQLAHQANTYLKKLGLAIRCPDTGMPSFLLAYADSDYPEGRYRVYHLDEDGRQKNVSSMNELHEFTLMPDTNIQHRGRVWAQSKSKSSQQV